MEHIVDNQLLIKQEIDEVNEIELQISTLLLSKNQLLGEIDTLIENDSDENESRTTSVGIELVDHKSELLFPPDQKSSSCNANSSSRFEDQHSQQWLFMSTKDEFADSVESKNKKHAYLPCFAQVF